MEISLLMPVFNEAHRLEESVKKVVSASEKISKNYEILLLEDGSTDGTDIIAKQLSAANDRVKFFHNDQRLGKGGAIKRGVEMASSEIIVTLDSDLSLDLAFLKDLVNFAREEDICIASRYVKGSMTERSFSRDIASRVYNFLVRFLFNSKIRDHQSGFKSFNKKRVKKIIESVENNGFIFDAELLIKAQKNGLKIREIPVSWKEDKRPGSFNFKKDSLIMAIELFRFWLKERNRLKF